MLPFNSKFNNINEVQVISCGIAFEKISLDAITPIEALRQNCIFFNENNVMNLPATLEDVIKSNSFFNNIPHHVHFVTLCRINKFDAVWNPIYEKSFIQSSGSKFEKIVMSTNPILGVPLISYDIVKRIVDKDLTNNIKIKLKVSEIINNQ